MLCYLVVKLHSVVRKTIRTYSYTAHKSKCYQKWRVASILFTWIIYCMVYGLACFVNIHNIATCSLCSDHLYSTWPATALAEMEFCDHKAYLINGLLRTHKLSDTIVCNLIALISVSMACVIGCWKIGLYNNRKQ